MNIDHLVSSLTVRLTRRLYQWLTELHDRYRIVSTEPDGDCFYSSVSGATNDPVAIYSLRRRIVSHMESNAFLYAASATDEEFEHGDSVFAKHLFPGEWCDNHTMQAFANLSGTTLLVHDQSQMRIQTITPGHDFHVAGNAPEEIHLLYRNGNHYDLLVPHVSDAVDIGEDEGIDNEEFEEEIGEEIGGDEDEGSNEKEEVS